MHPSHTTSALSDRNDDTVSPYLRRRLRSYAQYLGDLARQKAEGGESVADTSDDNPGSQNGDDNDGTD